MSENKWRVIRHEVCGPWVRLECKEFCLSVFDCRAIFAANPVSVNVELSEMIDTFAELRESIIRLGGKALPSNDRFAELLDDGIAKCTEAREGWVNP